MTLRKIEYRNLVLICLFLLGFKNNLEAQTVSAQTVKRMKNFYYEQGSL